MFLLYFLYFSVKSQFISIPFTVKNQCVVIESFEIGDPPQTFSMALNSTSCDTWIASDSLNNCFSNTYKLNYSKFQTLSDNYKQIFLGGSSLVLRGIEDTVLSSTTKMDFYIATKLSQPLPSPPAFSGALGIKPDTFSYDLSFVSFLKKSAQIGTMTVNFKFTNRDSGVVTFGKEIDESNFLEKCSSDYNDKELIDVKSFYCSIKEVKIESDNRVPSEDSSSKTFAVFDTSLDNVLVPFDYLKKIFEKIQALSKGECTARIDSSDPVLSCSGLDKFEFPVVVIKLSSMEIRIDTKETFESKGTEYLSTLKLSRENNVWYLGTSIISNFSLSYNYQREEMFIFKKEEKSDSKKKKFHFLKIGGFILLGLLFVLVAFLCLRKKKRRKIIVPRFVKTATGNKLMNVEVEEDILMTEPLNQKN